MPASGARRNFPTSFPSKNSATAFCSWNLRISGQRGSGPLLISSTDEAAEREIALRYRAPYPYASSLEIPVKSSASAILKRQGERFYAEKELFPEDTGGSKTDKETGIAYHAFLERADLFAPPEREAERIFALFEKTRPELAAKLNRQKMARILAFPLFGNLRGFTLYREQEFLRPCPQTRSLQRTARTKCSYRAPSTFLPSGGTRR